MANRSCRMGHVAESRAAIGQGAAGRNLHTEEHVGGPGGKTWRLLQPDTTWTMLRCDTITSVAVDTRAVTADTDL